MISQASARMATGSYIGTGEDQTQSISAGFEPTIVFITRLATTRSTQHGFIIKDGRSVNFSGYGEGDATITSDGFEVSGGSFNEEDGNYYYVAFGIIELD